MLKPLQQWFCDRCGEVIEKPEDGWVHWRTDGGLKIREIEILHHLKASPRGGQLGCYPPRMEKDRALNTMLGPRGLIVLLSYMDVGEYHDKEATELNRVGDVRNWVTVMRRLHLPYYEEARKYFAEARRDGELEGINEVALFLPDTLEGLVRRYGGDDAPDDDDE